jgi:hypothetical protein
LDVLDGHILQKGRLPHAGLPDHVGVASSVLALDAEFGIAIAIVAFGKKGYIGRIFFAIAWWFWWIHNYL